MAERLEFETGRLILRQWRAADRVPLASLNADPRVMEFFPSPLTRAQSDLMADRCQSFVQERGWGPWAVESKETHELVGVVGLHVPSEALPFSPCVEILWRLAFHHWGKGFASEAATEALRIGFQIFKLREIVSFAVVQNRRSRAVMERLGMQACGTFDHPALPPDSDLRLHCLYRLARQCWHRRGRTGFVDG